MTPGRRPLLLAGLLAPLAPATRAASALAPTSTPAPTPTAAPAPRGPQRPLRLRSAYPPGGVSDEVLRALAQRLSSHLGQPVLVEHWPGAGGTLAMASLREAPADGQVLVFSATSPLTVSPHLMRLRYDPLRDITPLAAVVAVPVLVAGTPALPSRHLVDALRSGRPLRWASSGIATTGHLVLEAVRLASGAPIVHVPYKGGGQQISDALAGHVELLSTNVAPAQLALVAEGRLSALAVGAPQPLPQLPGVPTLAQLGHADANLSSTFGLFASARTPAPRVAALHAAVDAVTRPADWQQHLAHSALRPLAWGPAEFAARLQQETRDRAALVKRLGPAWRDDGR